ARGFADELLDDDALAVLDALANARERVQDVRAADEGDAEQEFPVAKVHHHDLVRRACSREVHEQGKLARLEPVGERAAGDRGEAAGAGTGEPDGGEISGAAALRRELEAEVAGRERDAARGAAHHY